MGTKCFWCRLVATGGDPFAPTKFPEHVRCSTERRQRWTQVEANARKARRAARTTRPPCPIAVGDRVHRRATPQLVGAVVAVYWQDREWGKAGYWRVGIAWPTWRINGDSHRSDLDVKSLVRIP